MPDAHLKAGFYLDSKFLLLLLFNNNSLVRPIKTIHGVAYVK